MNEAFRGRFGPQPPGRTTTAAAGRPPREFLVEIDCIACLLGRAARYRAA